MSENQTEKQRSRARKSPSFPYTDVETCVQFVRALFEKARFDSVRAELAMNYMGLRETSSTSVRTVSAMVSYGLLRQDGRGEGKTVALDDLSQQLMLSKIDETDAYRIAALNDSMMRQAWSRFKRSLPDDKLLRNILMGEFGFTTQRAAEMFIEVIRKNYEVAKLSAYYEGQSAAHSVSSTGQTAIQEPTPDATRPGVLDREAPHVSDRAPGPASQVDELLIPIHNGDARLKFPMFLSKDDAQTMRKYLTNFVESLLDEHIRERGANNEQSRQEAQD